jgi:diadenosine tetraphosphate (Ap4A) HIT family hydrolase
MFRYRKNTKKYKRTNQVGCPFCDLTPGALVKELPNSRILKNMFPYDVWEFRDVEEHLMVTPRRHVKSLSDLNKSEQQEILDVIKKYESHNYNIYMRSVESVQKTVPAHQHTHLIKTSDKKPKAALYLKKPYVLIKK